MKNLDLTLHTCCTATLPPAAQATDLAILFVDIRNFTGLMETQPTQAVIQVVHRLFTAFGQIVKNFKGKVVEVAGDSLYAVFGLQTDLKEAANDAYQAAQRFFKTVDMFNAAYADPYEGYPLQIGIGLHAGEVFVSEFDFNDVKQMSVMGLPVNIASRLQSKTKELNNDLIISEKVFGMLDDQTGFEQRAVTLQGISKAQEIRLAGKSYVNKALSANVELDYLLAISG